MNKRSWMILSLLLFVLLKFLCLYATAEVTDAGLHYTVYETCVEITGYDGTEEVVVVPATIDQRPVTSVIMSPTEGSNAVTKKVVLPDTIKTLGSSSFARMPSLEEVEGLEYVQELEGYNFGGTKVTELLFSEALRVVGTSAFECESLRKVRIPDDVQFYRMFTDYSIFRYNISLAEIELIETGNTPTLAKNGPALYTADMKTLIIYPCGYKGNLSYRIPDGVGELATYAFDIRDAYVTDGLMDVVVPESVSKIYENTFYTGLYVVGDGNGTSEHFVMPHLHVHEDSAIAHYCENMGYTYFLQDAETVTIEERIAEIAAECTTAAMTDYEKAFALNQWLVDHVVYDDTMTHFTADSILFEGTGVCQSFMLVYEMLLNHAGIESRQFHVEVNGVGHGFNAVYLNGEWCYVDTTWNNNTSSDSYFGMNVDMVGMTYGMQNGFDPIGVGKNDGYRNYHPYCRGEYHTYLANEKNKLAEAVEALQNEIIWTMEDLQSFRDAAGMNVSRDLSFDAALLAAYLRDQSFGEKVYTSINFDTDMSQIVIYISYNTPFPENFQISKTDAGIRINRYLGSDTAVVIPSEMLGLPVVEIGANAFENCKGICSISMPDTVVRIGDSAFFLCESLQEIQLSSSLAWLGDSAFGDCYALESIVLPEGLSSVGANLFFQCTSLKNVTLPESLTELGLGMFTVCRALQTVTLPTGMTAIPEGLFEGCEALIQITIPAGVTSIGKYAFMNTGLTELILPNQLALIDECAFLASDLETLMLPVTMKEIASEAFRESNLKHITLNEGLTRIGEEAFYGSKLESIVIPSTVTELGEGCFDACSNLKVIDVAEGNTAYCAADQLLFNADKRVLLLSVPANSGTVRIPASVRAIAQGAFRNNAQITEVIFEGKLETLGDACFAGCSGLTRITIPEGVKVLPVNCFAGCEALAEVNLPSTLTAVGDWAFMYCLSLREIDLPDGVTSVELDSFTGSLDSFRIPRAMCSLPDNTLNLTSVGELYVHPDVTYIGLNNLPQEPQIVYGITGSYAQQYAEKMGYTFKAVDDSNEWDNKAAFSNELLSIEKEAFANTAVEFLVIEEGCTAIGEGAFAFVTELKGVSIPASVQSIDEHAFERHVVLIVEEGSYAHSWGVANGYVMVVK